MKFGSFNDMMNWLWDELELSKRSIIFNRFDIGDRRVEHFGTELIESPDDMHVCDAFWDVTEDDEDAEIHVYSVETWMLGSGEADHASGGDIDILEQTALDNPSYFDTLLCRYADLLTQIEDFDVENPWM